MARKLGRATDTRLALIRNLATDVILHGRVETTEAKAKELRTSVDKLITLGKRGDLHARRQAASFLYIKKNEEGEVVLDKLFSELAERYENRQGGYTRVLKLGPRRGDGANMAVIELVEEDKQD